MTSSVGLRAAALAGIALLGIAIALAAHHHTTKSDLPAPVGQWYTALAAPYTPTSRTQKSACGVLITPDTAGVAHPVLPCGAKIYVGYGGSLTMHLCSLSGNTATGGSGGSYKGTKASDGVGEGGGLYLAAGAAVSLDAFTVAHATNNHASTSDPDIYGPYTAL